MVWRLRHGRWWMVQWCFDWWFSLGIHVDLRQRVTGRERIRYGPYVDLHLGVLIVSLGVNPYYSGDLEVSRNCSIARARSSNN